jgi:hypothetical protein
MNITDLKKTLTSLHAELKATDRLDQELQNLLVTLDRDIQSLLKKKSGSSEAADLAESLRSHAARFAAEHPSIEATLREIAATLGSMGI